jgi:hypothetical protein
MGYQALQASGVNWYNVAVGDQALQNNTGASNVAVGYQALHSNTGKWYNVAVGYQALSLSTGTSNVALGTSAGYHITNGSNNIFIGYSADANSASDYNEIVIGYNITGHGSNTITIGNSAITDSYVYGTLSNPSDARLKNIKGDYVRGLDSILELHPAIFSWKSDDNQGLHIKHAGFIAQDVEKAIPEAVTVAKDGYLMLQDRTIIATLVNAIKDQQQEIKSQQNQIDELKKILSKLSSK